MGQERKLKRYWGTIAAVIALAVAIALVGCNPTDTEQDKSSIMLNPGEKNNEKANGNSGGLDRSPREANGR